MDTAEDFLRYIFYPYGTRTLDHASQLLAIKMVKLMHWWLTVKPSDAPAKGLIELVRERRIIEMRPQRDGRLLMARIGGTNKELTLSHLIRLFKIPHCAGKEIDALIKLIIVCIDYKENNACDMRQYLAVPALFEPIWRLYFDPLLIETVESDDERACVDAIDQPEYIAQKSLTVRWTDGREDVCTDGVVHLRESIEYLVHQALNTCKNKKNVCESEENTHEDEEHTRKNKEKLMDLLKSMQLSFIKANHLFKPWLNLYKHLMQFYYFDVTISQYLFDRLLEVNLGSYPTILLQFIFDLFDIWPLLIDKDLFNSVHDRIVQLIRILIAHTTHDSNVLIEKLIERICANTPENNVFGYACFFLLLSDLLPIFYEARLSGAIKKIGKNTLLWYVDSVLGENNPEVSANRSALMVILNYVSMYTEDDLLHEWFNRIATNRNDIIRFQLIECSLCPTTTLATYVQPANSARIEQLLYCIQSNVAKGFIPFLLTILESLEKNASKQNYLFQSDHLHRIIQTWLPVVDRPSIIFRLIEFLLDIGYSKHNKYACDIAQFFLGEYSSVLISINFEDYSPFTHIVLFITSLMEINETNTQLQPEILIKTLFRTIDQLLDDENNSGVSHLLSLSREIVKQRYSTILIERLTPFIPEIMGLLGRTGSMKKVGIILLAEILNLSPDERSVLADNIQDQSSVDNTSERSNINQGQQTLFFSSEVSNTTEIVTVRHDDFDEGHKFLTNLNRAETDEVDQILRSRLPQQSSVISSLNDQKQQQRYQLILTLTACENVSKILEVLDDPIPILLEGSTGVGKSASIIEAAQQSSRTLVRYNMSSRVTIDDLLGKVSLVPDKETQITRLQFDDGPFTIAFARGYWIMFDELNLAQDTVLQAIESALDTRQLTINNSSSAEQSVLVYQMHPDFRLFATQNPTTGFFKGKREKLSPSFLSRFRPLVFKELPDNEWCQIVQQQLTPHLPDEAEGLAKLLVEKYNTSIRKAFNDPKQSSLETGPYAETSIRELLKWVNLLISQKTNGLWSRETTARATLLSFSAWCVYGARCRSEGRTLIKNILTEGLGCPKLENIQTIIDQDKNSIYFDTVRYRIQIDTSIQNPRTEWAEEFKSANPDTVIDFSPDLWKIALEVHTAIHKVLMDIEFIRAHGIYRINRSWLWEWLTSAARSNLFTSQQQFAIHGSQMYQSRFRHKQAQELVRNCFSEIFKYPELKKKKIDRALVKPELPYVLTDRVLSALKQVCFNMNIKQPILVTGAEGCGKSELLLTLAWFSGQRVHQLNITPETEPSALIGQLVPNDSKNEKDPNYGQKLIWQDGCVTQAYTKGQWVLLDNLGVAESSVLERLNPVLEQKPMLVLTEHGDVHEQRMHEDYQLVATMTPPENRFQSQNTLPGSTNELSPALYNRFSVVHMPDISFDIKDNHQEQELLQITGAFLSDELTDTDRALTVKFCRKILDFYTKNRKNFPKFTMRNIVRLLDSTYLLRERFNITLDFISSLWTAYHVIIANQIKDDILRIEVTKQVRQLLTDNRQSIELRQPTFINPDHQSKEHILTPSRLNYANAVLGAVECNIPLLLEGPAAVGKTALISYLSKIRSENGIQLERVNNTDTTTIQDYLGTFLPVNDGFVFQKGALYRAMENGSWLLADEFNLADPSVMNMLFPLLEGKNAITIPSSGKIITAKPGFQFFATQNDASYTNRYQLPVSLRNRFLEIQFGEFPEKELPDIIFQRNEPGKLKPNCLTNKSTEQLAQFYHRVLRSRSRITFRELVKWLHRHAFLSPSQELWPAIGISLLGAKYPSKSETRNILIRDFESVWPRINISTNPQVEIKDIGGKVRFREGELYVDVPNMILPNNFIASSPETFLRSLTRLAFAVVAKEPVLLVGPTSCKTRLIETWTNLSDRSNELIKVHLTPDTEAADLIGEIQPYSFLDLLKRLPAMAECVYLRFQSLCRHHNTADVSKVRHETFLKSLKDAIKIKLPNAIRLFENDYSRDEERRQQKDELNDDFDTFRTQAESLMKPKPANEIIVNVDSNKEPTPPIKTTASLVKFFHSEEYFDNSYQADYGQSPDEVYETIDDGFSSHLADYNSTSVINDGLSSQAPTTESNIPSEDLFTVDDGFRASTNANQSRTTADHIEQSIDEPIETLLDDGFSNVIRSTKETKASVISPNRTDQPIFPEELKKCIADIREQFKNMLQHNNYASFAGKDATLLDYQTKFNDIWERLNATNFDRTKPIFLFNDGPVTVAAKRGGILFLEDLDLPSQAVIERLNSMLEPSPTFALTEDITSHSEKGQLDVALSNQFQIFASVHQEQVYQLLKLSPATRSRFTEIHVPAYSEKELELLIKSELSKKETNSTEIDSLVEIMFSLRKRLHDDPEWKVENDIQLLFRWTDFIVNHYPLTSPNHRMFLGARFFYFDQLPISKHANLFIDWNNNLKSSKKFSEYEYFFRLPQSEHGAITLESIQSMDFNTESIFPFQIGSDYISLKYTDVRFSCEKIDEQNQALRMKELRQRFKCVSTATFINQIARIFAATSSKSPLLLEGPPGIGKTQVITQVCALLNKECERINMSANTSLDQLIGCIIPRVVNGTRIFQWQEGRLLTAIRNEKWILFDELNLAIPEVLEGLTPLFYRGATEYLVPTTGEIIPLKSVRLFATMNPSTIGGGRNKLPRSISNLFTIVQLDDYSETELRIILDNLFQIELSKDSIRLSQLDALFDLHTSLKELVRQGTIGRTGGPYELNLRDLSKFRDVFRGSIDSQLFHYQYMSTTYDDDSNEEKRRTTTTTAELSPSINVSDSRFLSIRKFAQVVYACRFHGQQDFDTACELINSKFPINATLSKRENDCSIDTTVAKVVRIGSIYISTGSEEPISSDSGLIHTKKTVRQLELLAAACQSKRTILLEGDICSRKSSLVMELARLTRQHLIIIPLHENFETSDLIGSWRPIKNKIQHNPIFDKIDTMFKKIIKMVFLIIMPLLPKTSNNEEFTKFKNILRHRTPISGSNRYEMIQYEIESLNQLIGLLNRLSNISELSNETKVFLSCYTRQADHYATKLKTVRLDVQQDMSFTFVESEFVQAIREGWWILLDNINSAPSEVLERLNSLTEDNPMLSLYENSNGQVLTKENKGIHSNFRLFTTANLNRIYSNKLSSAFLNRVIRIWLPPIDECHRTNDSDLLTSDLYELVSNQLLEIPAGKQLSHLLVLTHINVKQYVKDSRLNYPSDFLITYRLIEQCIKTLCYLVKSKNVNPVDACYWSIIRSYCSSLQDISEYRFFIHQLKQMIDQLQLRSSSTIYSTPSDRFDEKQTLFIKETQRLRSYFIQFEKFLIEFQITLFEILISDKNHIKFTRDLLILFLDEIFLRLKPSDNVQILQFKQNLMDNNENIQINLSQIFSKAKPNNQNETLNILNFRENFRNYGLKSFEYVCDHLNDCLNRFIRNTSFNDANQRLAFLQRSTSSIEIFQRFFSSSLFDKFDQQINFTSLCSHLTEYLRPLLTFKDKLKSYELFNDAAFIYAKDQFRLHTLNCFDPDIFWSFERAQTFPIRSARKDLRQLIQYIIKDQTNPQIILPLKYFISLQEWIALQWTFEDYLTSTVQNALQKNLPITHDFILDCELKFSSWELSKQLTIFIDEIVENLPVESTIINQEYLNKKTDFENKQIEFNQCQEIIQQIKNQISIQETSPTEPTTTERPRLLRSVSHFSPDFDDLKVKLTSYENKSNGLREYLNQLQIEYQTLEQKRSTILDKALNGSIKLQNQISQLSKSSTYQFIQEYFQKSDAKQLNHLYQLLNEVKRTPNLFNSNGLPDLRAVLSTPFGRTLIEYDDILQTPLIFILCNFFVLPNLFNPYRFYFISDWKQLQKDFDIRTINHRHHLFFYCPTKQTSDFYLFTIENQLEKIIIRLWSLQQSIDLESLKDILLKNIEYEIEHKQFSNLANNLTNNNYQTFGLACLIHLYEKSNLSTFTTDEFYEKLIHIFDQLKEFIQQDLFQRKSLTYSLYQNFNRFEKELQTLNLNNYTINPWFVLIEQMWIFIKSYRDLFSSIKTENIRQELKYTIQSIQLSNLGSRLTSLAYLETLKDKYNCVHLIFQHVQNMNSTTKTENIQDFQIFFQFIDKINYLLKLITKHVLFGGLNYSDQFYKHTPKFISFFQIIFRSILSVIDIHKGQLLISIKQTLPTLTDYQKQLDQYLNDLSFPIDLLSKHNLCDLIIHLSPLYDEQRLQPPSENEPRTSFINNDPREIRRKTMQSRIDTSIKNLTDLLARAGLLSIRPHCIIQRIHSALHQLKNFDLTNVTDKNFTELLNEEQILMDLFNKFKREIDKYTSFNLILPDDKQIHQLTEQEIQLNPYSIETSDHEEDFQKYLYEIHQASRATQSTELNQIIRLTHAQVSDQTWIQTMSLLTKNDQEKQLKTILMILNDHLAMQIQDNNHDLLIENIILAYAQFRYDLLNEETRRGMLSNYTEVSRLSKELQQWTKKTDLNVFNLLETIKKFKDDLNLAQNQIKNFTTNASCNLLPVDIRPEDLICLLAPEYTSIILTIFTKFYEINAFLSCQIDQIQPMQLSPTQSPRPTDIGLSSYIYRRNNEKVPLFDEQKHIYPIINRTSTFLQKLIDICMDRQTHQTVLMQISTSIKELFPIHIALSFGLLVLINSAGICLEDFKEKMSLLTMATLKIEQNEIKQAKINLQKLGEELVQYENGLKKIRQNREEAEVDLHLVRNQSISLIDDKTNRVLECQTEEKKINEEIEKKKLKIDQLKQEYERLNQIYRIKQEQEQENWLTDILQYFHRINNIIENYFIKFREKFSSIDLLDRIIQITFRQLLEPSKILIDRKDIFALEQEIYGILAEIQDHLTKIMENDPIYSFTLFYCHLIRMGFSSLHNSLISWDEYSKNLVKPLMKSYAENTKKKHLSNLTISTNEQCLSLLNDIRMGYEQTQMMERAQIIKNYVRREVATFDISVTSEDSRPMQLLIREFERFVINLLIVACRFIQFQHGINEPLDELFNDLSIENLDLNLPNSEVDLLELLEIRQMQLQSHSSTLLFLPLHIVFNFNSNPFSLFDQLDHSTQAFIQLILPSAYMIKQTWLTIDELIRHISKQIQNNEFESLIKICQDFQGFIDKSNPIDNHNLFIINLFKKNIFESISKHFEELSDQLNQNRPGMKVFCDDLIELWDKTIKEILRGFIQTQKYSIHRQLEWNQRTIKQFSELFQDEQKFCLADIEKIVQRKKFLFTSIDFNKKSEYFKEFDHLQILYQLTLGGIDNLELIIINKPIEQMNYSIINQLFISTLNIYQISEIILLKKPFVDFIRKKESINETYQLIEDIYQQESKIFQYFSQLSKEDVKDMFQQLINSMNFQWIIQLNKQAEQEWKIAGQNFIDIRRQQRRANRGVVRTITHGLSIVGQAVSSVFSSSSTSDDINQSFAWILEYIVLFMQSEQMGNDLIFTKASSDHLEKLIQLYDRYKVLLNLTRLNDDLFSKSNQIYYIEIDRYDHRINQIILLFWIPNQQNPFLSLPISLNHPYTKFYLIINTPVTYFGVDLISHYGNRMKWSTLTNNRKPYYLKNAFQIRCERVINRYCYVVRGIHDTLSANIIPNYAEIQDALQILQEQLEHQLTHTTEAELFQRSLLSSVFQLLDKNLNEINRILRCPNIDENNLSNPTNIYKLFNKFPNSDSLNRALNLLENESYPSIPSTIVFVTDDNPSLNNQFDLVLTNSMNKSFQLNRQYLIDSQIQLNQFINYLRQIKSSLILSYAWTNSLVENSSSEIEFSAMLNEFNKIPNNLQLKKVFNV